MAILKSPPRPGWRTRDAVQLLPGDLTGKLVVEGLDPIKVLAGALREAQALGDRATVVGIAKSLVPLIYGKPEAEGSGPVSLSINTGVPDGTTPTPEVARLITEMQAAIDELEP